MIDSGQGNVKNTASTLNENINDPLNWNFSLEDLLKNHEELCKKARGLIEAKGKDYNRKFVDINHLANICAAEALKITSTERGLLTRSTDKWMRIVSLGVENNDIPEVEEESLEVTICDLINYLSYLLLIKRKRKCLLNKTKKSCNHSTVMVNINKYSDAYQTDEYRTCVYCKVLVTDMTHYTFNEHTQKYHLASSIPKTKNST